MNLRFRQLFVLSAACLFCALTGCRTDEVVVPVEEEPVGEIRKDSPVKGFYLLNEGNMGSNKCSLDYYSYLTGIYSRNIYSERNPNVVKELGDVGNDIQIHDGRLYAVINCSHKVEVMDAATGIRVGQIDVPNCRYIRFNGDRGYISSYVGPVQINPAAPKGMVYEFDTETLAITRTVTVGYQPEEMEIVGNRLYVANSGGYRAPDYDYTVSVIDLKDFRQVRQIPVAVNLHRVRKDNLNRLWVTSRGNRGDIPSRIYLLEPAGATGEYEVSRRIDVPCSNLALTDSRLYYIATEWSDRTQSNEVSYGVIDLATCTPLSERFITDGTESEIAVPYGIAVHPETGDIFVTDAKNYVSSGTLYCFSATGRCKWKVRTGDIPAAIAFDIKTDELTHEAD